MIKEVSGDILLTDAQAIAHGVAPNDHFNTGLALALREQWPAMSQDFRHYCHQQRPKPGGVWMWGGVNGKRIINLLTQEPPTDHHAHPGRASLNHVSQSLRELRALIDTENITSLALPRLATGVGGLDWSDVFPLINKHLGDLKIPVYVYSTYHKGEKAPE